MTRQELKEQIKLKRTFLCVGLDTDISKIPKFLLDYEDPIFEFNKRIIDATHKYCVAYKPNTAFYERHGARGWESLAKTIDYAPKDCFIIADAKRGDIGNTATYYADAFFKEMNADAITVAPYMGKDSVSPFLNYPNKWAIVLAMTSNPGSLDFQFNMVGDDKILAERVVESCCLWGTNENLMFVVGATRSEDIMRMRKAAPSHFFLVPGVGAQGGSLEEVVEYGWNEDCGLLVNSSRSIIYAGHDENFAEAAEKEAKELQQTMAKFLALKDWH